jgi:quercetin dioxygenase-like cupin family protein
MLETRGRSTGDLLAAWPVGAEESPGHQPVPMTTLINTHDGPAYDHLGLRIRVPLHGRDTEDRFALMEQAGRRGAAVPVHRHSREAETFVVLDGELDAWSNGEHSVVTAGSTLYLPPHIDHAFAVRSDTARFLLLLTPSGFEQFFIADGQPASMGGDLPPVPGPPPAGEIARLADLLSTYGVELVGPPPGS